MSDWLELCRAARAEVEAVLARLPAGPYRERVVGSGQGGDDTTAVDDEAERAVVSVFDGAGIDFTLVSEELGHRSAGGEGAATVVLDPIDGSINAKRGIPFFSLSVAVAEGPTMADVVFAYVHDLGSGEEWTATRGGGSLLDGVLLPAAAPRQPLELLALEATKTALVEDAAPALTPLAERLRIMGSLALSLCQLAAGRVDAVASLRPARSVDIAAAQLVARECGLSVELIDDPPLSTARLDLVPRSRVVAGSVEGCAALASALV